MNASRKNGNLGCSRQYQKKHAKPLLHHRTYDCRWLQQKCTAMNTFTVHRLKAKEELRAARVLRKSQDSAAVGVGRSRRSSQPVVL